MAYYPLSVDLNGRKCVVIGGGAVAERKVEMLREFGAAVLVVSPQACSCIRLLALDGSIEYLPETYSPELLEGAFLAIAATDDREVNRAVSEDARSRGVLVNVVDDPELCTFTVPAYVRRGDVTIGISTAGQGPALAKRIREILEKTIGPEYGELAELLGQLRGEIKARYPDYAERNRAYLRILDSDVLQLLAEGKRDEANERARECIS